MDTEVSWRCVWRSDTSHFTSQFPAGVMAAGISTIVEGIKNLEQKSEPKHVPR